VRPTQDRVREALFSALAARVPGARVLDLFSGTGALGIESWSRGAGSVCCVESHRAVFRVLKQNLAHLCDGGDGGEIRAVPMDAFRFLRTARQDEPFDLIFADPPYLAGRETGTLQKILRCLYRRSMLAPDGLFVYEQGDAEPAPEERGWRLLQRKKYGETRLLFYGATDRGDIQ
jgi:16S rRNA (guanine966-N2)-methyltransferase